MSKVNITGTIVRIGEMRELKKGFVREIVINRKWHDPQSGELKNEDWFPLQVFGELFTKATDSIIVGGKVKIEGFVNGRRVEKDGSTSYFCNLVAKSIEKI